MAVYRQFSFSAITKYDIPRGLHAKGAVAQLGRFERLCASSYILLLTDEVITRAAMIYADLHRRGELIGDADILIAATALEEGLTMATNNVKHFARISSLIVENWLK